MSVEPVTAAEAARRLNKRVGTIRSWASRYDVRRVGTVGRVVYFDYHDLAKIERQIRRGLPVDER